MKMKVTGVVKYDGIWRSPGDILPDVKEDIAAQMIDQEVAEEIAKTPEEIQAEETAKEEAAAKKEAEKQLKALRKKATELGIEGAADKDAETLTAEIEAAANK